MRSSTRVWRLVAINVAVLLLLLLLIEGAARALIYLTRGTSTVGLPQRTIHLRYQPFTMFGPDMDVGLATARYARPPGTFRVLLVGGSTAQEFAPTLLEQALAQRFPGRAFQVINASYGGYEARQEVIVAAIWGPALQPDAIVSIDGANDLESRLRVDRPGTFYLDPAYRLYLTRPFLAPFAYLLSQSQAYNGLVRLAARSRVGSAEAYADAIPVYVAAQQSLNALARGLAARRVVVLQPFNAYKQPKSRAEADFTTYKYREPVLIQLYDRAHAELEKLADRERVAYLDGRRLFDGIPETIFSDDVHFDGDKGYRILAAAIAARMEDVR
jgi:lysophospholipase L1-like esterase